MTGIGMKVIGFVTDGEWNKLRTQGTHRPVSIIQLMMDSKEESRHTSVRLIAEYLKPVTRNPARPSRMHNAVPMEDVEWLAEFMDNGALPFERASHILRRKHFPFNYDPHPWVNGKEETKNDCLKSLMTMYLFRAKISTHFENGVDFKNHLYVAEIDEITQEPEYQREDHNHVFKRITACLREGVIPGIDMRYFVDALNDPYTGLTYTALTGQRKQSVPDCERIFSRGVLQFMVDNGHQAEAKFVKIIRNWHKASDGRGLDEDTRSKYNRAMLDWLLEDWMPWSTYDRTDYSTMDANRPIKGIQGLTREVVVALLANIESQEHRRHDGVQQALLPEHPRASSTDDVEGFFSIIHGMLGQSFDLKTFFDQYPKIINEFYKRIDPNTPFFYWASRNGRYNLGPLRSFNAPSGHTERLDQVIISRRADPGVFEANRASLPQRGRLTVRAEWHRAPECLPPQIAPQNL